MSEKLTFYTHPYSRGRTVRWMLEELAVPYEVKVMEFGGSMKSPEYLAINPMGKVPALVHGDTVVTEAVAICSYLADQFPDKGLAPPVESRARGSYYRWLFFIAGPFEQAMTAKFNNWVIDDSIAASAGCGHVEDVVTTLEGLLQNREYICADRFTTADLVVSAYLGWMMMQKQIDELPVFIDYVTRHASRAAAQRAQELDEALGASLKSE